MIYPRALAALAALLVAAPGCGFPLRGELHSRAGELGTWDLRPTRCTTGKARGLTAADLFSNDSRDDTEVVVVAVSSSSPVVLARVPARDRMMVLRARDCARFRVDVRPLRPGSDVITGELAIDCALPDGGHLSGEAAFTCID